MRPTVRGAQPRDIDVLAPLVQAFQAFEKIPYDDGAVRRSLARLLDQPQLGQVLLAEVAGRPIGYAIFTYGYDLEYGGMDAFLTDLFLIEEQRDRGVGSWLMAQVEAAAREHGVQALHLLVAPANHRAHHLYYKRGFKASPRLFLTKVMPRDQRPG
jgi:GNAT superfamily N-acetyltransferase